MLTDKINTEDLVKQYELLSTKFKAALSQDFEVNDIKQIYRQLREIKRDLLDVKILGDNEAFTLY